VSLIPLCGVFHSMVAFNSIQDILIQPYSEVSTLCISMHSVVLW
jgi:hypothetical protein